MADLSPVGIHMRLKDLAVAMVFALGLLAVATFAVSVMVTPPVAPTPSTPVARVTTADLRAMADLARAIVEDPHSTPAQVRTAGHMADVAEAVESGEVQVIPPTTRPPIVTSTTTTTTTVPPTTELHRPPRIIAPPWGSTPAVTAPGHDA